jgi:hypothetical protein
MNPVMEIGSEGDRQPDERWRWAQDYEGIRALRNVYPDAELLGALDDLVAAWKGTLP